MNPVNVIGMGYIGLPTALMFAASGIEVVGSDIDTEVIDKLSGGQLTFDEPGLKELFLRARKNVRFATEYISTDIYIVAVPTPYDKRTKKIDATYIVQAVESILDVCADRSIIAIESTISPGTIDLSIRPLLSRAAKSVNLAHVPERILPGNMLHELVHNSRTIGSDEREIGERLRDVYGVFCKGKMVLTSIKTAEITKVVENAYRDINIAFANELCKICYRNDLDVSEVIEIANRHPRVNILNPGPGVGGHCISVDPWFLVGDYPDIVNIILAARKVNDSMPDYVIERLAQIMDEHGIRDISEVGLYGLAYKEDVDDVRESPTLQMIERLEKHLCFGIKSFDPHVKQKVHAGQMECFSDFIHNVKLVVIMVGHRHIKERETALAGKIVFDTRRVFVGGNIHHL